MKEKERGRSLEDDYFRKRDQELTERLRSAAAADRARAETEQVRTEMGQRTGISDPELLRDLVARGFTPDTVVLLPLVPAVQMAWAEGGVSGAERDLIVKLARSRGVVEGSAADQLLAGWLSARPGDQVFAQATRLIRAMLAAGTYDLTPDELVQHYESIAAASGGVLGMARISAEERRLLTQLADGLRGR
jgi:hypothetical protein